MGFAPANLQSRYARVNGWRTHYMMSPPIGFPPAGKVVVLVHGVGLSHRYMMPTAEWLTRYGFTVLVPDQLGFGYSDKPPEVLSFDQIADHLADWIRELQLARVMMLGNSVGCQIIVTLAVRHPELVQRAVLQGMTVDPRGRTWRRQYKGWKQNGKLEKSKKKDFMMYLDYLQCGPWRALKTFKFAMDDRPEDKLPHMRCPTMVIRGSRDPIISQEWTERQVELLPNATLRVLPGLTHTLCYMAPLELTRVGRPFLANQPSVPVQPVRRAHKTREKEYA